MYFSLSVLFPTKTWQSRVNEFTLDFRGELGGKWAEWQVLLCYLENKLQSARVCLPVLQASGDTLPSAKQNH